MTANLSNHLVRDRIDRMNYIVNQIGIGTVIIEAIDPKTHAIRQLTDTGIMIIKSEKEDKIITLSTCSTTGKRFIVQAVRVDEKAYQGERKEKP